MKNWKILSPFKEALLHPVLLVFLAWMILSAAQYRITVWLLSLILWSMITGERPYAAALILSLFLIPVPQNQSLIHEGRVTRVKSSYCIVENGGSKLLVYTRSMPVLDSTISFDGVPQEIESSRGFYRFDFAGYCRRMGVTMSVTPETIREIRPSRSVRGWLMKEIIDHCEEEDQDILLDVLLQIRSDDAFIGIFKDRGFSLSGVISLAAYLLSFVLFDEDVKRVTTGITLILAVVFHFPYLLSQRLIYLLLERAGLEGKKKTGIGLLIGMRLFPSCIFSASFLIPALRRLSASRNQKNLSRFWMGCQIESVLFHAVNPIELLCFRFFLPFSGLLWLLSLLEALFHIPAVGFIRWADRMFSVVQLFSMPGSMLGFGLIFYIVLILSFRNKADPHIWYCGIFLFFQLFGLFHPLAELTFINVGQGDAILLRGPFQTSDILIDTGKPSQWNQVKTMLESKGIQRLDVLMITHADNDHSGNQDNVTDQFHPRSIITEHHPPLEIGVLKLFDLNEIKSEDENESSIVTYVMLNGMKILLMGDSSEETEEAIIHSHDALSADILKLSHHGSATGSSPLFLDTVQPELAIVSAGSYAYYHHPSPSVIERLNARNIPYLNTREEGDISIFCFPGFNLLITSALHFEVLPVF